MSKNIYTSKEMMSLLIIVTIMNTWNGKQVNWARIVHHKTGENSRGGKTKALRLGSYFLPFTFRFVARNYARMRL